MTNYDTRGPRFREFSPGGDARHVVAEVLARRAGRLRIAPMDWSAAGAIVQSLRDQGFALRKPTP